jgi:hypothetical protein
MYDVPVTFVCLMVLYRGGVIDKLYLMMLYTSSLSTFELTTSVVIGTDCIGSCKFNYHTILAMTAPSPITEIVADRHEEKK